MQSKVEMVCQLVLMLLLFPYLLYVLKHNHLAFFVALLFGYVVVVSPVGHIFENWGGKKKTKT